MTKGYIKSPTGLVLKIANGQCHRMGHSTPNLSLGVAHKLGSEVETASAQGFEP